MNVSLESPEGDRQTCTDRQAAFDESFCREIDTLAERFPTRRAALHSVLRRCQERSGWVSETAMAEIAERLGVSTVQVAGVVTFNNAFRTQAPASHVLDVCTALSCHVRCARDVLTHFQEGLHGNEHVDVHPVGCLGGCQHGPAVKINGGPTRSGSDEFEAIVTSIRRG